MSGCITYADGNGNPIALTSRGEPDRTLISADGATIIGYVGPQDPAIDAGTGVPTGVRVVLNVAVDERGNGSYSFQLVDVLDHPAGGGENDIDITFAIGVYDSDGLAGVSAALPHSFTVRVNDDEPGIAEASIRHGSVDEEKLAGGNAGDSYGSGDLSVAEGDDGDLVATGNLGVGYGAASDAPLIFDNLASPVANVTLADGARNTLHPAALASNGNAVWPAPVKRSEVYVSACWALPLLAGLNLILFVAAKRSLPAPEASNPMTSVGDVVMPPPTKRTGNTDTGRAPSPGLLLCARKPEFLFHGRERGARLGAARCVGPFQPLPCKFQILRHADAFIVHEAQVAHGSRISRKGEQLPYELQFAHGDPVPFRTVPWQQFVGQSFQRPSRMAVGGLIGVNDQLAQPVYGFLGVAFSVARTLEIVLGPFGQLRAVQTVGLFSQGRCGAAFENVEQVEFAGGRRRRLGRELEQRVVFRSKLHCGQ